MRVRGRAWDKVEGQVTRAAPAGSRKVAGEALTTAAGGEVLVDPSDPKKETTVAPQWVVEVAPLGITKEQIEAWKPGLRARVRFSAAPEPLLQQWWRDLRQYLDDKASV